MPRLMMFAACEKVLIGDDGTVSIISLMQGFGIPAQTSLQATNETLVAAISWTVFSLFERTDDADASGEYEQHWTLRSPSGRVVAENLAPKFSMPKRFHRIRDRVSGFPLGEAGDYVLSLYLRPSGGDFQHLADYPIPVSIDPALSQPPPKTPAV